MTVLGQFQVEEATWLATSIIVLSMYDQCYVDGNEYLLLESITDYRRKGKAHNVKNTNIFIKGKPTTRNSTAGCDVCCK